MKRAFYYLIIFFGLNNYCNAQVGINTSNPAAALHIDSISENEKNGILLPQLDEFPITMTADQDSMMIYITGNGSVNKGYWFYEHGSGWRKLIDGTSAESLQIFRNPKFPDGMKGIEPITVRPLTGYTIPTGKNFYITAAYSPNNSGAITTIDFNTGIVSNIISDSRGSWVFPTFNNPIIIGQGQQLSGTYTLNGFLVDATVEPIFSNNNYTVPTGKIFVYLNANVLNAVTNIEVRIDGQVVTYTGVLSSDNNGVSPLSMPLFLDENQSITVQGFNSTILGYLIDK